MKSVSDFITRRLQLKVHESKSAVDRPSRRKFLGFTIAEGAKPQRRIAPQALKRFREKVRKLTRRTRGVDAKRMVSDLTVYLRGWVGYFGFCETPWELRDLDGWIRRRLRAVAWKQWKRGPTRCRELMRRPRPWNRNDSALHSVVIKAASLRDTKPFIQSVLCHRMQPLSIPSGRVETWRGGGLTAPFPSRRAGTHRTGRADFSRRAGTLGQEFMRSPTGSCGSSLGAVPAPAFDQGTHPGIVRSPDP